MTLTVQDLEKLANEERRQYRRYAAGGAYPRFREILGALYATWDGYNERYFTGQLQQPHITIGQTPPRSLGFFSPDTDWGSRAQITINRRIVWGKSPAVINTWPALGTARFIDDILLHETIHQWQHEIARKSEDSYGGHGSCFADKCNEIGALLGLPRVVAKRRTKEDDSPRCAYWPHNVRPDGYYCEDVDLDQVLRKKPKHEPTYVAIYEFVLAMLEQGRISELEQYVRNEIRIARGEVRTADTIQRPFDEHG
jgi:hypothetical protein